MEKSELKKHYFILIGLIVLVIAACLAFYNIFNIITEKKISTSPLAKNTKVIAFDELYNATKEIDADTFLIIGYTDSKQIYNNEKNIQKFLNKKNMLDQVLYLDVSELKSNENFINELNITLALLDTKIESLPAVVFYKDAIPTYIIDSSDHLLNYQDFEKIMDMYELAG